MSTQYFDVIVIGGGHAGTEAANAASRKGCSVGIVTLNPDRIGFMSCNPAIGGLGKGHLVKEIDAFGGVMARVTDLAAIQYRVLNRSKGPAVQATRAQCDKEIYSTEMKNLIRSLPGVSVISGEAVKILTESNNSKVNIYGIELKDGSHISAKAVIVTSGTFLKALMYTGFSSEVGGRAGDQAAVGLSQSLMDLGLRLRRLKTGTPARLHKDSINWSVTEAQPGDRDFEPFSVFFRPNPFPYLKQVPCYLTYTNEKTHELIEQNFNQSPMFMGLIQGVGPRYCPSIEDKVKRFRDKNRHQVFLEPEGLDSDEIYVNGVSTSLPASVQDQFLRTISGLENCKIIRHGYAVEYDAVDSRQLSRTFECKDIAGLYFAGQVNGTSGYEEAGAQGLVAGLNAALKVKGEDPFVFSRYDSYIGVLVDDLCLVGSDEPYRMFTSRAENRLFLREDNSDLRLSESAWKVGMLTDAEWVSVQKRREQVVEIRSEFKKIQIYPTHEQNKWFESRGMPLIKDKIDGETLLRRPEVHWEDLVDFGFASRPEYEARNLFQAQTQVKYEGYIKRDEELMASVRRNESVLIPLSLNYSVVPGLSTEIRTRLEQTRPETLGQAGRIQGVTPAAVANLMIYLRTEGRRAK